MLLSARGLYCRLLDATRQELKIYMHGKLSEIRFANAATMNALS
jgi:hypothetical protein